VKLHPLASLALLPFSWIYRGAIAIRNLSYAVGLSPARSVDAVIISVGNITVGGTGKTPMVMYLAERLADQGKNVGILSRGYRGRAVTEPRKKGQITESPDFSDETWLMHRNLADKVRLGVGADRWMHAVALRKEGIDWFILDDGFQHSELVRDVDIVLIDSSDAFGNGRLLPAGPLREPLSSLARADMIVITRDGDLAGTQATIARYTDSPVFHATTDLKEIVPITEGNVPGASAAWLGKNIFAFCGIGNSGAFFRDVRRWGVTVVGQKAFADHHRFTARDCERIERKAAEAGAEALLCTDKDIFNLQGTIFRQLPLYVCRITMRINQERQFWETLSAILERKQVAVKA